jgi:hypothetical protein
MVRTLIASANLIGDTLTQVPALRAYKRWHPEEHVTWLLHDNPSMQLFHGLEGLVADQILFHRDPADPGNSHAVSTMDIPALGEFDRKILLRCTDAWQKSLGHGEHISQGYAKILDVKVSREEILAEVRLTNDDFRDLPEVPTGALPVSMRSASSDPRDGDGFSGNKNFPVKGWLELFRRLGPGYSPVILMGPEDAEQPLLAHLPRYRLPIRKTAAYIRSCGQYAGVDNGITHLAAALQVSKMFVIYPWCLPIEWVGYTNFPFYHPARLHPYTGDVERVWRDWHQFA